MPARRWNRSKPIFEMVEAAFAEAIFIGLRFTAGLPHSGRREGGKPRLL
jgi:hypothetical protein